MSNFTIIETMYLYNYFNTNSYNIIIVLIQIQVLFYINGV